MSRDNIVFNNFLKLFGIYREFYRELRSFQPGLSRIKGEEIEFPDDCSSENYIIFFFDWRRTVRGPHFWALMDDAWRTYRSKNL